MIGVSAVATTLVTEEGVSYGSLEPNGAAANADMPESATILQIDGLPTYSIANLTSVLSRHNPGERVLVATDKGNYAVILAEHPDDDDKAYLGVLNVQTKAVPRNQTLGWVFGALSVVARILFWTWVISLGLGLANLLPIGPVDGGRMFYLGLTSVMPEKTAKQFFGRWTLVLLILVLLLVIVPIIRASL
jgi:membrane-associated protease RseP (regulator of RpoE activity)